MKKIKENPKNQNFFTFLSDKALEDIDDDLLNHKSIAKTLKTIISNCPTPFTIGVFGKWGTGKSTIGNFLCKEIENDDLLKDGLVPVLFDVWKYEQDSLRRQFLINIDDKLKLEKNYKETLNQSITKPALISFKEVVGIQLQSFLMKGGWVGIMFFLLFLVSKQTNIASYLYKTGLLSEELHSNLYGFSLFGLVATFIANSYVNAMGSKNIQKTDSAEGFENIFINEVLKHSKLRDKKLLIIVDNLDRVKQEKTVEILATIKTFLELKNCIFLVQCDEEAIKEHLKHIYARNEVGDESKAYNTDEFLRKFFNTYMYIPPFINSDLGEYTDELLKNVKIPQFIDNNLTSLITIAFRENPRQIKQFINTLISHFLLAREREQNINESLLKKDRITENVPLLAKLLLVKQTDLNFYKSILNDPKTFNNYDKLGNSVIQKIFNATPLIQAGSHLRSFIYYKESDISLKLEGTGESLKVSLLENNSDSLQLLAKEMMDKNIDSKEIRKFIINDLIADESVPTPEILNIINGISKLNIKLTPSFADSIINKISNYDIQHVSNLDTQFVFQLLGECSKQLRKKLSTIYVRIINLKNTDKAEVAEIDNYDQVVTESFRLLMTNSKKYQEELTSLKEVIASTYFEDEALFNAIDDHGLTDKLITNTYITNLISSISKSDLENNLFKIKTSNINKLIKLFNKQNSHEYLTKLHELISKIKTLPNDSTRLGFITQISCAIDHLLSKRLNEILDHPQFEEFGQFLLVLTTQESQVDQKLATIPSLYRLKAHVADANRQTNMQNEINKFADSASKEILETAFKKFEEKERKDFIDQIQGNLQPRALNNSDFFKFYFNLLNDSEKDMFLKQSLSSGHYDIGLNLLEQNSIKPTSQKTLIQSLISNTLRFDAVMKEKSLKQISNSTIALKKAHKQEYLELLKSLITTLNGEGHFGIEYYKKDINIFTKSDKVALCNDLLTWLDSQPNLSMGHLASIEIIILSWDITSLTNKEKVVHILFDKYLFKATDVNEIIGAGNFIQQVKPKYKDYEPHFEQIKSRLERETQPPLKDAILQIMKKIRPNRYKKDNAFWSYIDAN